MVKFLLWLLLLVVCWPLALLALILYPILWLLLLPFRVVGIAVDGVLELLRAILPGTGLEVVGATPGGAGTLPQQAAQPMQLCARGCAQRMTQPPQRREREPGHPVHDAGPAPGAHSGAPGCQCCPIAIVPLRAMRERNPTLSGTTACSSVPGSR